MQVISVLALMPWSSKPCLQNNNNSNNNNNNNNNSNDKNKSGLHCLDFFC